ncbi:uncharacterized protein LOC105841574 [Bombyx mori]|uniref:Endonuclease-reverse transcriptase n=1 Tax=Bombyx mori TaxID=7091 RepID=A0A8R2G9F8_BOMMO|nr:uncharacterized protein LOC105841574 [Bombyx mori]
MMGDFNAQVGVRKAGEEHIIGKYEKDKVINEFRKGTIKEISPILAIYGQYPKPVGRITHNTPILIEQGIQNVYINIIKKIYSKSKAGIRLESMGDVFPIERGVRQGDPLSPKLLTAVLEQMFRKLEWELGLNIG